MYLINGKSDLLPNAKAIPIGKQKIKQKNEIINVSDNPPQAPVSEIYASDGELGPALAAFMQTSDTTRLSTEKLSETGTAERAAGDWAKEFRKVLGD